MTSPSPSEPRTNSLYHAGPAIAPRTAVLVAVAAMITWLVAQVACFAAGVPGVAVSIVGDAALVATLVAGLRVRQVPLAALGMARTRLRWFGVAALIGVSAWYLELVLIELIQPPGDTSGLDRLISEPPLTVVLVAVAVAAPIGEELLFRGVIARTLAQRLKPAAAIVISAAMFSAFHLSLPQALPTFVLGIALGLIALRSGSIVPGIVLHAINNAIVILIGRGSIPAIERALDAVPAITLGVAVVVFATGFILAARMPA